MIQSLGGPMGALKQIEREINFEEKVLESLYVLMRKFKMSYFELIKLPLPTYFLLLKMLAKEGKMNKREMNKIKRKR